VDPAWAWARYRPDAKRPWGLRLAAHLYRRAGFGADWGRLERAVAEGPDRTIDRLVRPEGDPAAFDRSFDAHETASIDPGGGSMETLRGWWLRRMLDTPHPLQEKMTLFWHHHFAVNGAKVASARLVQRHLGLLRAHALGRLGPMLDAVAHDAALLVSLNGETNRRSQPSDTYAQHLMEMFGLGPDQYTPSDVRGVARAFTGWFVIRNQLRYIEREHDPGLKRIFGQEGNWKGPDALRIVLAHSAVPRTVVRKLYRWLVSETEEPGDALIAPLAEEFAKDHDIGRLVETMLRSNLFFSPRAYRQRIKSPVEFALGIARAFETTLPTQALGHALAELGQNLGTPPTARGWPGGKAWLNPYTLAGRANLAQSFFSGNEPYQDKFDPAAVAQRHGKASPRLVVPFLVDLLVDGTVASPVRATLEKIAADGGDRPPMPVRCRQLAYAIATLPEFQLA
jgi:uncharacterized protein (DUF1800 family)